MCVIDAVEMFGLSGSPILRGVDVPATMKDNGITALDEIVDIIDEVDDRRQDQRHCPRANESMLISVAGAESGRSQTLGVGDFASDNENEG